MKRADADAAAARPAAVWAANAPRDAATGALGAIRHATHVRTTPRKVDASGSDAADAAADAAAATCMAPCKRREEAARAARQAAQRAGAAYGGVTEGR